MVLTYLEAVACFVLCQHSTWHILGISRNISFLLPSGWKTSTSHHNGALKLVPCRQIKEKEAINTVGSQRALSSLLMDSAQPPFKEGIYIAGVGGSRVQEVRELKDSLGYRVRACHSRRGQRGGRKSGRGSGGEIN